jgi:hypothetical protein
MCFQESESKIIIEIKENKAHAVDVGVYQRPRRQHYRLICVNVSLFATNNNLRMFFISY